MNVVDHYPDIFRQYVVRGVCTAMERIHVDGDPVSTSLNERDRIRALHTLSLALELDTAWTDARQLLLILNPRMENEGYWVEWLPYLEKGLHCSQIWQDLEFEAELSLQLGHLHRLLSNFSEARQWLTKSIERFAALHNLSKQAKALSRLAYVARLERQLCEAKRLAEAAQDLLAEDDPERAASYSVLGAIALDEHQWQTAADCFRHALRLGEQQDDKRQRARDLGDLGVALWRLANHDAAEDCYRRAIALFDEVHVPNELAVIRMNLGIVYSTCNKIQEALDLYEIAEPVFRKMQDRLHLALVYNNQGFDYRNLEMWDQAENAYLQSIAQWQQLDNILELANARDGLGMVYLLQGKYEQAIAQFQDALVHLKQSTNDPEYEYLVKMVKEHLHQALQEQQSDRDSS